MNNGKWTLAFAAALLIVATAACSTDTAPGLKGHWQPVNRFSETAEAIPIENPGIYYVAPVDATLKTLLERWAKESSKSLSYRHPTDFTLHARVAGIRTASLSDALSALSAAYADHDVSIVLAGQTIVVTQRASGLTENGQ